MPDRVIVSAPNVRLAIGVVPPMMPPAPMLPELADAESACAPLTVPVKVTLPTSEIIVASPASRTGPVKLSLPPL